MAVALNSHLSDGTNNVDVANLGDIAEGLCDFYNVDGNKRRDFHDEFIDLTFSKRGDLLIHYIENILGASFYSAHDHHSVGRDDGFDYKEAIEKAKQEGNDMVVVENLS